MSSLANFEETVSSKKTAIREARTCYDHLAGKIGVEVTRSLVNMEVITKEENQFLVTAKGEQFLTDFGVDLSSLRKKRRAFSRCCLDWSEREHHLAGALGFGLLEQLFQRNWIKRIPGTRAIAITDAGKRGFSEVFHINEI